MTDVQDAHPADVSSVVRCLVAAATLLAVFVPIVLLGAYCAFCRWNAHNDDRKAQVALVVVQSTDPCGDDVRFVKELVALLVQSGQPADVHVAMHVQAEGDWQRRELVRQARRRYGIHPHCEFACFGDVRMFAQTCQDTRFASDVKIDVMVLTTRLPSVLRHTLIEAAAARASIAYADDTPRPFGTLLRLQNDDTDHDVCAAFESVLTLCRHDDAVRSYVVEHDLCRSFASLTFGSTSWYDGEEAEQQDDHAADDSADEACLERFLLTCNDNTSDVACYLEDVMANAQVPAHMWLHGPPIDRDQARLFVHRMRAFAVKRRFARKVRALCAPDPLWVNRLSRILADALTRSWTNDGSSFVVPRGGTDHFDVMQPS